MMYLVDFAGTLFDIDAFDVYARTRTPNTLFTPGELSRFLYGDAASFLFDKGNSVIIVTAADKVTDANFMESALHGIPRTSVMYTNGTLKGEHLAPYIGMYGQAPVFVDDSTAHLASMELHCPNVQLFEMRRDGRKGNGRWPVVHTLGELP
jgi:hypothetical protein